MCYPEVIEQEYTFDVPEGFSIDEEYSYKTFDYIKTRYSNGNKIIEFKQAIMDDYNELADNEKSIINYYTDESGIVYTVYSWENSRNIAIIWGNYGYSFTVLTNCNVNDVIDLCIHTKSK